MKYFRNITVLCGICLDVSHNSKHPNVRISIFFAQSQSILFKEAKKHIILTLRCEANATEIWANFQNLCTRTKQAMEAFSRGAVGCKSTAGAAKAGEQNESPYREQCACVQTLVETMLARLET